MTYVSYAQNYEDVMLSRALRGIERGFYIDIGAQDPINDSVTNAFYQRGWRGINIEPVEHWYERLVQNRPHDINLQVAVSDHPGRLRLFEVEDTGLSTTDPDFAEQHANAGMRIRECAIECVTLESICDAHVAGEVHFMKIDCEGAEAAALRGMNLERTRPWIILVEATKPNSQEPAFEEWEPLLTARGYFFAYEDGLNRFYVASEHADLARSFAHPPNVFDRFVRASEAEAHSKLQQVQRDLDDLRDVGRLARAEAERDLLRQENERRETALVALREALAAERRVLEASRGEVSRAEAALARQRDEQVRSNAEIGRLHREIAIRDGRVEMLQGEIAAVYRSTSWVVTAPLRFVGTAAKFVIRWLRRFAYQALRRLARLMRPMLRRLAQWGWLRSLAVRVLGKESRLSQQARLFLFGPVQPPPRGVEETIAEHPLSRSAQRALDRIEEARRQQSSAASTRPSKRE